MAIATSTAVALALAAAAAGTEYYNTEHTAHQQDQAAAQGIRNQGRIQKEGDAKVNEAVSKLAASNAESAKAQRLDDYLGVLRRNKGDLTAGLTPVIGSNVFKTDAATAANDVQGYAANNAGLMARMDAPGVQRQQEGVTYGQLGTDLGLVKRDSQGQDFLDQLKLRAIRRNAGLDLAAGLMSAGAGAAAGGAGGAAGSGNSYSYSGTLAAGGGYTYNMPTY